MSVKNITGESKNLNDFGSCVSYLKICHYSVSSLLYVSHGSLILF